LIYRLAEPKLTTKRSPSLNVHYIDPKEKPAVEIVFKYRSKREITLDELRDSKY